MNIKNILPLEGWHASAIEFTRPHAIVKVEMNRSTPFRCPQCCRIMQRRGFNATNVRDLPLGISSVMLRVQQPIGYCFFCNLYHTFRPSELHPSKAMSWRLMKQIASMLKDAPAASVAKHFQISASSVLRADRAILEILDRAYPVNLENRRFLIIDEKHLGVGQKYLTCVIDNKGEMLFMARGRSKEVLSDFFRQMTQEQRNSVEAVSIDRSNAYYYAIKDYLPYAKICFDPFHIISNVNEAINAVRRTAHLYAHSINRAFVKGSRFLLVYAREKLSLDKLERLDAVFEHNVPICKAYWLKEQLRGIYKYCQADSANLLLDHWFEMANQSKLSPFQKLASTMKKRKQEIVNFFRYRLSSGRIEGLNSSIELISRKMRGIGSVQHLFLKLRQRTCPQFARLI